MQMTLCKSQGILPGWALPNHMNPLILGLEARDGGSHSKQQGHCSVDPRGANFWVTKKAMGQRRVVSPQWLLTDPSKVCRATWCSAWHHDELDPVSMPKSWEQDPEVGSLVQPLLSAVPDP